MPSSGSRTCDSSRQCASSTATSSLSVGCQFTSTIASKPSQVYRRLSICCDHHKPRGPSINSHLLAPPVPHSPITR
ncbi:hypothetical protein BKA93DRAFT_809022 [Sparassis latifolia]